MPAIAAASGGTVRRAKSALFFALLISGLGQSFMFAILPPIGRTIGLAELQIGAIMTVAAVIFMIASPVWGRISERWGRRRVVLTGLVGYAASTALFGLAIDLSLAGLFGTMATFLLLTLLRSLYAALAGGIFPAAQAYIADVTGPAERTAGVAMIGAAFGLGMIAGPAAAAALAGFSLVTPFYGVAVMALVAAAVAAAWIVEPDRPAAWRGAPRPRLDRRLLPFFGIATLMMATLATVQQATGFFLQDKFGLTAAETAQRAGLALMAMAAAVVFGQALIVGRLKWPPRRLLRIGAPTALAALALLLIVDAYPLLVAAMALFGIGIGLVIPGYMAALSLAAGPDRQGAVAGLTGAAQALGFIIGPLIGAGLYDVAVWLPFAVAIGLCATVLAIALTATTR